MQNFLFSELKKSFLTQHVAVHILFQITISLNKVFENCSSLKKLKVLQLNEAFQKVGFKI